MPPRPRLIWNASASAPIGLYGIIIGKPLARGDMVAARLFEPYRTFAAQRRYLPVGVPLIKRVAAAAGESVCARGRHVRVNGRLVALRRRRDEGGRLLPWWEGCRRLGPGELFLLMNNPASFDGRYFGSISERQVIGKARLLWTR